MKIAIIGGGPIGIEAALYGAVAGHDVTLFERGRIGENVRAWAHVHTFTEWARNRSPLTERLLSERGDALPPADAHPSGADLADFLLRVVSLPQLRGKIVPQCEVVAITRDGLLKSDFFGDPRRQNRPFRLLTRGVGGEKARRFDAVIDATGVYTTPNFAGLGGVPCPGESGLSKFIHYTIPEVAGRERTQFHNKHTLIIGSGHSAATTLLAIADLMETGSKTRVTWVVRRDVASSGEVFKLDPDDIASGRRLIGERANSLVKHPMVDFRPRTALEGLERRAGRFVATLSDRTTVDCDTVCAHTGFRPDATLWQELQIAPHPATGAPSFALGEALNRANARAGVGLSTGYAEKLEEFARPENEALADQGSLLRLDEPNFFVLGIKSYGRDAGFLMQNGFRQVREAFQLLSGDSQLDLYGAEF